MFRELAAVGALAVVIVVPSSLRAQSGARLAHNQATVAAKSSLPKPTTGGFSRLQLEPKAIDLLKAVSDRLAATHTLSFVSVEMLESPGTQGAPPHARRSDVTLQRPDQMRVIVSDGGYQSEVYCHGNTMMTYATAEKALVIAKAPPTIGECLKEAHSGSPLDFALTDLFVASGDLIPRLKHAHYLGPSQVADGTDTEVVAYSHDNFLVEMSVGTKDKLPRVMRGTYLDDPHGLRHDVVFSNWQVDVPIRPEIFTSLNVAGAEQTDSAHPHPVGTSGVQPAPSDRRLTVHTFGGKYWGTSTSAADRGAANINGYSGVVQTPPFSGAGYYSSPDGYGYYASAESGLYSPAITYYGAQCDECGDWASEDADTATANFNLDLTTSGWHNAGVAADDNQPTHLTPGQPTYVPGQTVSTLPVGCAAPYTGGPAFYLCGNTWFSGVYGPNGELYYRVISLPGY
jgi:hypothetical protein